MLYYSKIFKFYKTVEAEIKAAVHAQRVWEAESRAEQQTAKWTVEGAGNSCKLSILRRKAYVSCRRYVGISLSARVRP